LDNITLALNFSGTFAFGLSGGILAVKKRMDLFGVLVLSVATGLGGGIMRDLILGHTPPATITDWRYLAAAALAGIIVFLWYNRIANHGTFVTTFDAVGLSVFTVTGTVIALDASLGPAPAALLGMLTGASMLGAVIIIVASQAGFSGIRPEILAALATFILRMVSVQRGWKIPVARPKIETR